MELRENKADKMVAKKKEDQQTLTSWMCNKYYDIRTFGAVMTTGVNCGQVRGPVQFNFSKSIDPISPQEITITRMAVTNEKDAVKERTMGRKSLVPYGLYRMEGYISAPLANQTHFGEEDLEMLWSALINMFDHDRSASRGKMAAQKLIVFEHETLLGNSPAHKLFGLIKVTRKPGVELARSFEDYDIVVGNTPQGVSLYEKL